MKSLVLLPPEAASLGEPGPAASGLAEDGGASGADHDSLGVAEDSGDPVAAGALDVHEITVRMLNKPLQLVPPLFFSGKRVQ